MNQIEKLRHISTKDFALLGMQDLAYIKRITVNDGAAFAVHAADGTQVAFALPSGGLACAGLDDTMHHRHPAFAQAFEQQVVTEWDCVGRDASSHPRTNFRRQRARLSTT